MTLPVRRFTESCDGYQWQILSIVCGLMVCLSGCSDGGKTINTEAETATATAQEELERCEKKLAAALQRLTPDSMATVTRKESVVNALNSWLTTCASEESRELKLSEANGSMLSATAQRFVTAARYTENDTTYIRDCLLLRSLSEAIWKQADAASTDVTAAEVDRIVRLFNTVVRTISLMPADEERVPVGIYEVLLTGRGTVDDRIWIFAEALRQRQIDAFIIRPSAPPSADDDKSLLQTANVLVAVTVEPTVLLFDPLTGTAVPKSGDKTPLVTEPAGLEDLKAIDRWHNCAVEIVAQPACFSPRMLLLQEHLPAEEAATLYEELKGGTSEIQPIVERITAAGKGVWAEENVGIWTFPESQAVAAGALTEEQSAAYIALLRPYDAPFERDPLKSSELLEEIDVNEEQLTDEEKMQRRMQLLEKRLEKINESSEEHFGRASKRLLKTRLQQVMGATGIGMIQQLQQIRIASMQEVVEVELPVGDNKAAVIPFMLPENIRRVHRSATGDALFWTSLCQAARGDHGASVTTFRNYRRQYPNDRWNYASMINEAIALIMIGDSATAQTVLDAADQEDNPERRRTQWLLSRLQGDTSTSDPAPATATTSTNDNQSTTGEATSAGESAPKSPVAEPADEKQSAAAEDPAGSDNPEPDKPSDDNP